ncbi:MAG: hypothetical protein WBN92_17545, partial [Terriglobia bacterium]
RNNTRDHPASVRFSTFVTSGEDSYSVLQLTKTSGKTEETRKLIQEFIHDYLLDAMNVNG